MVPRRLIVAGAVLALASVALAAAGAGAVAAPLDAQVGKALFERNWVAAPSSTGSDDGLGPLFDARSCTACHAGGNPGRVAAVGRGSVLRVGNKYGEPGSIYGSQFQISALPGIAPEGSVSIRVRSERGLRVFAPGGRDLGYGAITPTTRVGLRRAPSLHGIGLLAAIPYREIGSRADPADRNRDGISGRVGVGRFGWKATQQTLASQVDMAFMRDMGLSTSGHPEHWGDCTAVQPACRKGPSGAARGAVEVPDRLRNLIVAYLRTLAPPKPLDAGARGHTVFVAIGCAQCHANPRGAHGLAVPAYSDLLLHDLGKGLDDGIAEGNAQPPEWRTAPLWDVAASLEAGGLMHDGRARNVREAVAWHGGEADAARARFDALSARDRLALVDFLMGR